MIEFSYPAWYLFFCALIAIGYSFLFYKKDSSFEGIAKYVIYVMSILRFGVVFSLLLLLLEPLILTDNSKVEKPIIVFAQDNSQSILANKDSSFYTNEYKAQIEKLISELNDKYELKVLTFGSTVRDSLLIDYSDKQTDISQLFEEVNARFYGRNVGAVIVASDGIFNKGSNPVYSNKSIENASIYTIALGDTSLRKDIVLEKVLHNKVAFLGNDFPIAAVIKGNYYKGQTVAVSLSKAGKILSTQNITFENDADIKDVQFKVEASGSGQQKYTVEVAKKEGELTYLNNNKEIFIEVLNNKQKILLLAAAPHPDLAVLQSAIEKNINYEVVTTLSNDMKGDVTGFSLVIAHQLPSVVSDDSKWIEKAQEKGIPVLFILGEQTNIAAFNNLKSGLNLVSPKGTVDVKPSLNAAFVNFTTETSFSNLISELPPLQVPFASGYKLTGSSSILLFQKVGSTTTNYPLIAFTERNNSKNGFVLGEGIWRWRMQNFIKNNRTTEFDNLISKLIQFVAQKEDKSKFRVNCFGSFFEDEMVTFQAELYNDIFELVNEPEVQLVIYNEEGEEFPTKTFSRINKSYSLNAGQFPPGVYQYKAYTSLNKVNYEVKGEFVVKPLNFEFTDVVANHSLLFSLAQNSGGKMIYPNQINSLAQELLADNNIANISYSHKTVTDLLKWKWIFFLIIGLLTIEWFLRKRNGGY
jgi:hypothetical protein